MEEGNFSLQMMDPLHIPLQHRKLHSTTPLRSVLTEQFLILYVHFLEESGLSNKYWEHTAYHVAYVKNRLQNKNLGCSPFEKLTNGKPSLHYIRVFGCSAFAYDENPLSKVHARSKIGIYLGSDDYGIFTVELLKGKKILYSRHVTFHENKFSALEFNSSSSSGSDADEADILPEHYSDDSDTYEVIVRGSNVINPNSRFSTPLRCVRNRLISTVPVLK